MACIFDELDGEWFLAQYVCGHCECWQVGRMRVCFGDTLCDASDFATAVDGLQCASQLLSVMLQQDVRRYIQESQLGCESFIV